MELIQRCEAIAKAHTGPGLCNGFTPLNQFHLLLVRIAVTLGTASIATSGVGFCALSSDDKAHLTSVCHAMVYQRLLGRCFKVAIRAAIPVCDTHRGSINVLQTTALFVNDNRWPEEAMQCRLVMRHEAG